MASEPRTREDVMTDVLCRASFGKFTEADMRRVARQLDRAIVPEATTSPEPARSGAEGLRLTGNGWDDIDQRFTVWHDAGCAVKAYKADRVTCDCGLEAALRAALRAATPTSPEPDTDTLRRAVKAVLDERARDGSLRSMPFWQAVDRLEAAFLTASKPDTDERERMVEVATERLLNRRYFFRSLIDEHPDRFVAVLLDGLTLGSGADEGLREAVADLARSWDHAAARRRATDKAGTSRGHEAANLLAIGIIENHAAALRAALRAATPTSPEPDTEPRGVEHKIAGDVVRAADGAWVPCSCGARMPFPVNANDRNGEPVTALVIHLQSLVRRPALTASKPDTDERERVVEVQPEGGRASVFAVRNPDEDESWRDPGIEEALRKGRPLSSFQRARILDRLTLGSSADAGLREAARKLADEAARAVTEPRRFHENEDERQQALGHALTAVRAALADSTNREAGDA